MMKFGEEEWTEAMHQRDFGELTRGFQTKYSQCDIATRLFVRGF